MDIAFSIFNGPDSVHFKVLYSSVFSKGQSDDLEAERLKACCGRERCGGQRQMVLQRQSWAEGSLWFGSCCQWTNLVTQRDSCSPSSGTAATNSQLVKYIWQFQDHLVPG